MNIICPECGTKYRLPDDKFKEEATGDDINAMVRKQLKAKGLIREDRSVVDLLDREAGSASDVIPVKFNKDGSFSKTGNDTISAEDFEEVSQYVTKLIKKNGKSILDGNIEVNPYTMGSKEACTFCKFKSVCGFDQSMPGYTCRQLPNLKDDEVMERIRTEK